MSNKKELDPELQLVYDELLEALDVLPIKYLCYLMQEFGIVEGNLPRDDKYFQMLEEGQQILDIYYEYGSDEALKYIKKLESNTVFFHNVVGEC